MLLAVSGIGGFDSSQASGCCARLLPAWECRGSCCLQRCAVIPRWYKRRHGQQLRWDRHPGSCAARSVFGAGAVALLFAGLPGEQPPCLEAWGRAGQCPDLLCCVLWPSCRRFKLGPAVSLPSPLSCTLQAAQQELARPRNVCNALRQPNSWPCPLHAAQQWLRRSATLYRRAVAPLPHKARFSALFFSNTPPLPGCWSHLGRWASQPALAIASPSSDLGPALTPPSALSPGPPIVRWSLQHRCGVRPGPVGPADAPLHKP